MPRRHSQKARSVHAVFKTYLDAIHFERSSSHQEEPDEEVDGVREQKERDHEGVDDEDNDEDGEDEEDEGTLIASLLNLRKRLFADKVFLTDTSCFIVLCPLFLL